MERAPHAEELEERRAVAGRLDGIDDACTRVFLEGVAQRYRTVAPIRVDPDLAGFLGDPASPVSRRRGQRRAAVLLAATLSLGALGALGALPAAAQRVVAEVADAVGVSIPSPSTSPGDPARGSRPGPDSRRDFGSGDVVRGDESTTTVRATPSDDSTAPPAAENDQATVAPDPEAPTSEAPGLGVAPGVHGPPGLEADPGLATAPGQSLPPGRAIAPADHPAPKPVDPAGPPMPVPGGAPSDPGGPS